MSSIKDQYTRGRNGLPKKKEKKGRMPVEIESHKNHRTDYKQMSRKKMKKKTKDLISHRTP